VSGDDLVLHVDVTDRRVRQLTPAWLGSCVEIFASPPDASQWHPSLTNPKVRQAYLVPGDGDAPARAAVQNGTERPAPEIGVHCRPNPDGAGYCYAALVPLRSLGLDPSRPDFLFQIVVTATLDAARGPERAVLFYGGISAAGNNLLYGAVRIAPHVA
jgi:hypothetical protein